MATLEKITKSEKGNLVGHIRVQKDVEFQGFNTAVNQLYFVRLADDKHPLGPIKGFTLSAWNQRESIADDGTVFIWLEPKI